MPRKRLSMRNIREILRLKHYCNRRIREISGSCGIGRGTVSDYLNRAKVAGISWPIPDDLTDTFLEQRLFPSTAPRTISPRFVPDFQEIHKELQSRKHVTLNLLPTCVSTTWRSLSWRGKAIGKKHKPVNFQNIEH
jgi:hypothetical protein